MKWHGYKFIYKYFPNIQKELNRLLLSHELNSVDMNIILYIHETRIQIPVISITFCFDTVLIISLIHFKDEIF
jgi:hypothetical protein